jgi:hypothetical protein
MDLWELSDLATPWCVHVVATLRVADYMAEGEEHVGPLAAACGADAESLTRVLRHLASKGLFEEHEPGRFTLNDAAMDLMDDRFRLGLDLEGFGGIMANAWSTLLPAVRTGKPVVRIWEELDARPAIAAQFDAMMGPAGHGVPSADVLFDPSEWPSMRTVADIGGGTGSLLGEILEAHPHLHGTLVDLPRTVARADLGAHATTVGQSFFDPLPAGKDLYLLSRVLNDWPDAEAGMILRRIAEAMTPASKLMVLSGLSPAPKPPPNLLMLVLVGGKDRTLHEFRELAGAAGLAVANHGELPSGKFAVECRKE